MVTESNTHQEAIEPSTISDFSANIPSPVVPVKMDMSEKKINETEKALLNLTPREESIFTALKEKMFISRLELAEIAWGKVKGSKASNDAIDQVISRLRKKFVQAGYPRDYIFAKKGEGVGLNDSVTQ